LPMTKWRGWWELVVEVEVMRDRRAERAVVRKARRDWRGRGISDAVCAVSCPFVLASSVMSHWEP